MNLAANSRSKHTAVPVGEAVWARGAKDCEPMIATLTSAFSDPRRSWCVAIILAALSTFSFLDRQVLALLIPDLKRDLHITDVQFGLLTGPAFILVYNIVLIGAAFIVDRWNRKWLICIGAVTWTLMTIASAFARSFNELLVLRGGLAFGEALLGPAAISLIGDLFSRLDRPAPTAAYITGSVIGATGSAMLSAFVLQLAGWLNAALGGASAIQAWRLTLVGVGLPGLLLAVALFLVAREPGRAHDDALSREGRLEPLRVHLNHRWRLYAGVFTGYGLLGMTVTALAIWGPAFLMRSFHLKPVAAGYSLGLVSLAAGLAGTALLPALFRRLFRERRVGHVIAVALAAILLVTVSTLVGSLIPTLWVCLLGFGVATFFMMGVGTLPTLVIQLYAPAHLRGRISAGLFFLLYLLSSGLAPVLVPLIGQGVFRSDQFVGRSIALVAAVVGVGAAAMFLVARPALIKAEADIVHGPN